jgi:hypothetical protein
MSRTAIIAMMTKTRIRLSILTVKTAEIALLFEDSY